MVSLACWCLLVTLPSDPVGELLIGFYKHCGAGEGAPVYKPTGFTTTRSEGIYAAIVSAI